MGNNASCAPSIIFSRVIKIVSNDGRVEEYTRPVNAAEVMLENPRQFICDSRILKVGDRIPGLAADEELMPHRLYFLLPMNMLYSVLTTEGMSSLSYRASKAMKQRRSKNMGRIFPVLGDLCLFLSEFKQLTAPIKNQNFSSHRSWRPALDTIAESPCLL